MLIGAFNLTKFIDSLSMTFVSGYFLLFVIIVVAFYYAASLKNRWVVLLVGSLGFCAVMGGWQIVVMPVLVTVISYCAALMLEDKNEERSKRRIILIAAGAVLLIALALVKLNVYYKWDVKRFVFPVGISYYTFSAISYMADVYWGKDKAERNYFKLLLFISFFPKILQGPIARYKTLGKQLIIGHPFSYTQFCYGMQLAVWGYFKKMVVADRISILTTTVFNSYNNYGGAILFFSMILAALQLYCDFSGCMDIAGGVSQMFGINLEQNFNHPFFAKSGAEFWQRWHMTLSGWFKDYLFLPISRSSFVKKFSKKIGNKHGAKARKNTVIFISSFFVWMATGLWHGSGLPYIVWGIYWYVIINSSILLERPYASLKSKLKIDEDKFGWKLFQMIRTYLVFSFGRLLTIPNDLYATGEIIRSFFTKINMWELFDGTLYSLGLTIKEMHILAIAVVLLWIVEIQQTKFFVREKIANCNVVIRSLVYSGSVIIVLIYGIYGPVYEKASFIYMNF